MIELTARSALELASRRGWRLTAAGLAALIAVAGCAGGTQPGRPASSGQPLPARKAIMLAAAQAEHISSLTARISGQLGPLGAMTAQVQLQRSPSTIIAMNMSITADGQTNRLDEILSARALYLKDPQLTATTGKPWIEMTLAELSSRAGVNFGSLIRSAENSNPENQVKLFTVSKDIHAVGSQTVNGVATTEYAGSYSPKAALGALPAGLRKLMAPMLRIMGSAPVRFTVWIDAQHLTRKAVVHETIAGQSVTYTYTITSVNQPVHVAYPPASEVAQFPHA